MEIVWTRMAKITFLEISENLYENWTSKEIQKFIRLTEEHLAQIKSGKRLHPLIESELEIRRIIIHPTISLYYKIKEPDHIYLLTFFNNRMDPERLKRILEST